MIGPSGGEFVCQEMNISLKVPQNAVEEEVRFVIRGIERIAPQIPCKFGEVVLSDVVQISPAIHLNKPAVLTLYHDLVEIPKFSSIAMKYYDDEQKKWLPLPFHNGRSSYKA